MTKPHTFKRSRIERAVRAGVISICFAILAIIAFDIFSTHTTFAKTETDVFPLNRRGAAIVKASVTQPANETGQPALKMSAADVAAIVPSERPVSENKMDMVSELAPEKLPPVDKIMNDKLAMVTNELGLANSRLASANQQSAELTAQVQKLEAEILALEEQHKVQLAGLTNDNVALKITNDELQVKFDETAKALATSQKRARELGRQLSSLQKPPQDASSDKKDATPQRPKPSASLAAGRQAYAQGRYAEAKSIWTELAQAGIPQAQFHLGSLLYEGRDGNPDLVAAYKLLTQAIAGGFGPAIGVRAKVRDAMTADELALAANG